tara:strand:- start:133 stop:402 length:270 start_codon:yes stop_codon:yes gene_type:complete
LKNSHIKIHWPNNITTEANEGDDWFINAKKADVEIPKGCLSGSCGACEIDVNGRTVRPCISNIKSSKQNTLNIEFTTDPYWNEVTYLNS